MFSWIQLKTTLLFLLCVCFGKLASGFSFLQLITVVILKHVVDQACQTHLVIRATLRVGNIEELCFGKNDISSTYYVKINSSGVPHYYKMTGYF
jgi:hypothetical protein